MVKLIIVMALFGAALGISICAAAHSGNGFETGPTIRLALALPGLGTVVAGFLALVGKRGHRVVAVGAFSAAMLVAVVVMPLA